jgi:hypothetical protein
LKQTRLPHLEVEEYTKEEVSTKPVESRVLLRVFFDAEDGGDMFVRIVRSSSTE